MPASATPKRSQRAFRAVRKHGWRALVIALGLLMAVVILDGLWMGLLIKTAAPVPIECSAHLRYQIPVQLSAESRLQTTPLRIGGDTQDAPTGMQAPDRAVAQECKQRFEQHRNSDASWETIEGKNYLCGVIHVRLTVPAFVIAGHSTLHSATIRYQCHCLREGKSWMACLLEPPPRISGSLAVFSQGRQLGAQQNGNDVHASWERRVNLEDEDLGKNDIEFRITVPPGASLEPRTRCASCGELEDLTNARIDDGDSLVLSVSNEVLSAIPALSQFGKTKTGVEVFQVVGLLIGLLFALLAVPPLGALALKVVKAHMEEVPIRSIRPQSRSVPEAPRRKALASDAPQADSS